MAEWDVRRVQPSDAQAWERMRQALWPAEADEHAREIAEFFGGAYKLLNQVLIAVGESGAPIGFAELSIRSHVDGCESLGVGYLEGWFVDEAYRGRGVGAALMRAAEDWARAQGCTEFGSDTWLDNSASEAAHKALGFEEVDRVITFRKTLGAP
jgi:aminoglycoside 6'-N-acetyltransferase I